MTESTAVIVLGTVSAIFLCAFWFAPNGVLALRRRAGGALQVDVRPVYSPETLYRLLEAYGETGRRAFRGMLLADMVFPALYGATLYLCGDLLGSAFPRAAGPALVASCTSLAASAFDYGENFLLLNVLGRFPTRAQKSARLAAMCTTSKMIAFGLALVAFLGGLAVIYATRG
jgi:hypothetical protein